MKIDFDNGQLKGQWLNIDRPPCIGYVGADCTGYMNFPDDRTYKLEFDKALGKIYWEGRASGNVWLKGNLLLFFNEMTLKIHQKREI